MALTTHVLERDPTGRLPWAACAPGGPNAGGGTCASRRYYMKFAPLIQE